MNNELFERLLYEEESTTLDFKKEQYRFSKASDDDKSELLKDILGFANAWRRTDAYILIGVEDIRGGRGNVVGIPAIDHLDDHSLQQFVNNLTNQPVHFHYKAFEFEGKQIGIISIDTQIRPIYLKRDYGKLVKEKVYIRRGSSTDPTKPASLEEIAQMRVGLGQPTAELLVEFAHLERDMTLGTNISQNVEYCRIPDMKTIPELLDSRLQYGFEHRYRLNRDFFRQLATFEFAHRLAMPIRLTVKNIGQVPANNVQVEITVPTKIGVKVTDGSNIPNRPERLIGAMINPVLKNIKPIFSRNTGDVDVTHDDERFLIQINCGNLQPGRQVWSDVFYIGKRTSGDLSLCGVVFADNLPIPQKFNLTISVVVTETIMTVDELCSLPESTICDE